MSLGNFKFKKRERERFHYTAIRMANSKTLKTKTKTKLTSPNFGDNAEQQEQLLISGENSQWFSLATHTLAVSFKTKYNHTIYTNNYILGTLRCIELKTFVYMKTFI